MGLIYSKNIWSCKKLQCLQIFSSDPLLFISVETLSFSFFSLSLSSHMCVSLITHVCRSLHTCVFLSSQLSSSLLCFSSLLFLPSLLSDHDNDHLLSRLSLCTHSSLTLSARVHGHRPIRWWANCSLHAESIWKSVVCCVVCALARWKPPCVHSKRLRVCRQNARVT